MKVLFDTNVLLDILFDREPFATPSAALLSKAEQGEFAGYACATTITTIFYLCCKAVDRYEASRHVQTLLSMLEIAPVDRRVIETTLQAGFSDFEDAVLSQSALLVSADVIATRNKKDFSNSPVTVYMPEELLNLLDSME